MVLSSSTNSVSMKSLYLYSDNGVNLWENFTSVASTPGASTKVPITDRVWPWNVFDGFRLVPGTIRTVSVTDLSSTSLTINSTYSLYGSQGPQTIWEARSFVMTGDSLALTVSLSFTPTTVNLLFQPQTTTITNQLPSSSSSSISITTTQSSSSASAPVPVPPQPPLLPKGSLTGHKAYVMTLDDDWTLTSEGDSKMLLLSLQGLVNRAGPMLYFLYPDNWVFTFTRALFDFYSGPRGIQFTNLTSTEAALSTLLTRFPDAVSGYVVFDPNQRASVDVALTVAGLEKGLVVSPRLVPVVKAAGVTTLIRDFSSQFHGMTDPEVYTWAWDQFGDKVVKNITIWTGGACGETMNAAVADLGVNQGAFHMALSTIPADTDEYVVSKRVLSEHDPYSLVVGWHQYCKDLERNFVSLTSSLGLRVEGLAENPNLSFAFKVTTSPDFVPKNAHNVIPGKHYEPANKTYITAVQTDGLGLGAWVNGGRGELDYAWECIINYSFLAPGRLEYFYANRTSKDLFIGALSGPGYMYPKAIPSNMLENMLEIAHNMTLALDLDVFEVMDYSDGSTITGNTDLPLPIIDTYGKAFPSLSFINGYSPSYTFYNNPLFMSFDYYLDPDRTEDQAAADLEALAAVNKKRPYFLLAHIREFGSVTRTLDIFNKLPKDDFEIVPLDLFLKLAGEAPTFANHVLPAE